MQDFRIFMVDAHGNTKTITLICEDADEAEKYAELFYPDFTVTKVEAA